METTSERYCGLWVHSPPPGQPLHNEVTTRPKSLSELKLPSWKSSQLYIPMLQGTQSSACKLLSPRISKGRPSLRWRRQLGRAQAHGSHFPAHSIFSIDSSSSCILEGHVCFWTLKGSSSDWPVWYNLFGIRLLLLWLPLWFWNRTWGWGTTHSWTCRHSSFLQARKERNQDCYRWSFWHWLVQSYPCSASSFLMFIPCKVPEPPTLPSATSKDRSTDSTLSLESTS